MSSPVRVHIGGEEHAIRTPADPEHTRRCAALVDERIREIQHRSGGLEGNRAAILAALSIADLYLRAAERAETTEREVLERTDALVQAVEARLGGGTSSDGAASSPGTEET